MTRLIVADAARLDRILDDTYPIWGEGLSRSAYGAWNRGQLATRWGRDHLQRIALVDGDHLLASAKRYDFVARMEGERHPVVGIGAVFTPEGQRGQGHARRLIDLVVADAGDRGCRHALLFSEIGSAYYESMGFRVLPREQLSLDIITQPGAPATFVRSGNAVDLPFVADISARYAADASFALDRSPDLIEFSLVRRRLLAGLGPAGLRHVEFFVAEEGHRAVAYVILSRGPQGVVLEESGDRDPAGARVGSMLQVLAGRAPAEPTTLLRGWLPAAFRPPQVRVRESSAAREVMMIRPIGDAPMPDARNIVYWNADVF